MVWKKHLVSDPAVKQGQLCAKGTEVTVAEILNDLSDGMGAEDILKRHPGLQLTHVAAALAYAADLAASKHCYKCVADDLDKPKRLKPPKKQPAD
ncbi:MAG: DUF433 domain-containing protein [Acidobacteriota bacterium]